MNSEDKGDDWKTTGRIWVRAEAGDDGNSCSKLTYWNNGASSRLFTREDAGKIQQMLESTHRSVPGDLAKLLELIRDIRIALLTTVDRDGRFHTRPVQTLQMEDDGTLWFFTDWSSPKVEELYHDVRVSLGYADPTKSAYVAVSGSGSLLRDIQKAKQLWSIEQRAYYPEGPEDERLALLRVVIERAEYWIAPGRISYLIAAARAAVTGTPAGVIGENRKIE
jgi:general stress protein 26